MGWKTEGGGVREALVPGTLPSLANGWFTGGEKNSLVVCRLGSNHLHPTQLALHLPLGSYLCEGNRLLPLVLLLCVSRCHLPQLQSQMIKH